MIVENLDCPPPLLCNMNDIKNSCTKFFTVYFNTHRTYTGDEVNTVIHYIDKMCDLLVHETEENGQQGDCLVYLLTEDILEQLVQWCIHSAGVYENKIKYELLKILENLIRYCL